MAPARESPSSTRILNVQLITHDQDAALLDLLRFPAFPLSPADARIRSREIRNPKFKSVELDELISSVIDRQVNQVEVEFRFKPWRIPESEITITGINNLLTVSPTSSVWKPSGTEPAGRTEWRTFRDIRGMEQSVKWHQVDIYPTLLQSIIEIDSDLPGPELNRKLFECLAASVPQIIARPGIFGAADLEQELGPANLIQALAPWPGALRFLNERFDALHPIMFGPLERCEKLASALGPRVDLKQVGLGSYLGIVHLPEELVTDEASRAAVNDLLAPRDDSTRFKLETNEEKGEFKLGTGMIFTGRRHQELTRLGYLSPPSEDYDYFHFIRPKYCELLGWDPDDMVGMLCSREGIRRVDAEIDIAFEELSHVESTRDRVLKAHREVNLKHGWAPYVMDFVERHYFDHEEPVM